MEPCPVGGQSQFSTLLEAQINGRETFARLHEWILEHVGDAGLTVEHLAEHAAMSPRNFSRVYTATTGRTPAKAIAMLRVACSKARGRHRSGARPGRG